jgi:hypothetical protein
MPADDRVAEAEWLLWQDVQVAGVLIDLGLLPIGDIPQHPKIVQEALLAVNIILKRLQEALASSGSPWD